MSKKRENKAKDDKGEKLQSDCCRARIMIKKTQNVGFSEMLLDLYCGRCKRIIALGTIDWAKLARRPRSYSRSISAAINQSFRDL